MKIRPINFTGAMVSEILRGRKTQTRRVIIPQPSTGYDITDVVWSEKERLWCWLGREISPGEFALPHVAKCRYGLPGDRLWVRESFVENYFDDGSPGYKADWSKTADEYIKPPKWKSPLYMPKRVSRILLEIEGVRVERVQDISVDDCWHEGMRLGSTVLHTIGYRDLYRKLWDEINAKRGYSWERNPWVWAIEFSVVQKES